MADYPISDPDPSEFDSGETWTATYPSRSQSGFLGEVSGEGPYIKSTGSITV